MQHRADAGTRDRSEDRRKDEAKGTVILFAAVLIREAGDGPHERPRDTGAETDQRTLPVRRETERTSTACTSARLGEDVLGGGNPAAWPAPAPARRGATVRRARERRSG